MAARKRRRSSRSRRRDTEYPGWAWMLFGLAIGLAVAFAVYVKDRSPGPVVAERPAATPEPASMVSALDDNGETARVPPAEPPEQRFDFYEVLPQFEVVIPEEEPDVRVDSEPRAVELPGTYVLQAGSFSSETDAERRRAQLALHGIESRTQRVTIDGRTYHRVRIGPTDDLDRLNLLRSRLRAAGIDVLRIRLGD